jgi:uncharacterized membrane protein
MADHIRNPFEWILAQFAVAGHTIEETSRSIGGQEAGRYSTPPAVRRIGLDDLRDALAKGFADFAAFRTDVIAICFIYPVLGLLLAQYVFGNDMLPLLFPLASGFALIGPAAAVGLYEMSRRHEQGLAVSWADAFGVVASPRFGAILALTLLLAAIFVAWLFAAAGIYAVTLGPEAPDSPAAFISDVLTTPGGWTMIVAGTLVGFVFALIVLAISAVSFPLLLDRDVGLPTAVVTSVKVMIANPRPMAVWGLVVAAGLALGSLPLFLGLAIVMPVLGHATWHLYRKVVAPAVATAP